MIPNPPVLTSKHSLLQKSSLQKFIAPIRASRKRIFSSRVLRDSSVLLLGNWINLLFALITSALLARGLGTHDFGIMALSMTFVNFIIMFIDAQTDEALIRFMGAALARGERDSALTFFYAAVALDTLVALVALAVAILVVPPVARAYPDGVILERLVWIFLLTTPFNILQTNFESIFKTFKKFRLTTIVRITSSVFSLVLLVGLAAQGVEVVIWGQVAVIVVTFVLYAGGAVWLMIQNLKGARAQDFRGVFRQLLPFVFHTSFMGSLKSIAANIDILLLGALASTEAVGFYKLAKSAVNLIALPVAPVTAVIYPMMNEAWALGNLARVKYLIQRFMLLSGVITVGLTVILLLSADVLVRVVYSENFLPVAILIRIMSFGVILESVLGWVRTAALSAGKPQLVTFTGTVASIVFIPLDFFLIYHLGAVGSALGYICAVVMMIVLNMIFVQPKLGLGNLLSRTTPPPVRT
jgi:O-antigen/teichoic acid export membrane protein